MKRTVIVCDDNSTHRSYLKQVIEAYDTQHAFDVEVFSDGVRLDKAIDTLPIDIAFLDMSMSGAHSIYLGRRIREKYPKATIVLITSSDTFELGAYELKASHYLVKPVMAHKIHAILDGAGPAEPVAVTPEWFSIQTKKRSVRIHSEDIRYLEKDQRKVLVHTPAETWDFYGTFKDVRSHLDMERTFIQCHQGFIVNCARISVLETDGLRLNDGTWIPVSRRFRPAVENAFYGHVKTAAAQTTQP